jgi:O-methyltransferase involved in polyketide biosynthesis
MRISNVRLAAARLRWHLRRHAEMIAPLSDLGAVEETLLIPLYMRARETLREGAICSDPHAVQIVRRLDYDFGRFDRHGESMQLDVAVRTEILDQVVSDFLDRFPECLVVNLGAGLDARFQRLDNGKVVWFDIDLPNVIGLRRAFYRESLRNPFVPASVLDDTWLANLDRVPEQPVLLLAEGLLPYLEPDAAWGLFDRVADHLPGAHFVFQSISPGLVHQEQHVPAVNQTEASFEWGIHTGREVAERDARYEFLDEWAYIDRHQERWQPVLRRWWYVAGLQHQMREIMKISHVRVRQPSVVSNCC